MTSSEILFFDKNQNLLPIYAELCRQIDEKYPEGVTLKVSKTQISFINRHIFLCVSIFKKQFMLTLGLPYRSESPRIMQAVAISTKRWTHHIIISGQTELDAEIMNIIDESYALSQGK